MKKKQRTVALNQTKLNGCNNITLWSFCYMNPVTNKKKLFDFSTQFKDEIPVGLFNSKSYSLLLESNITKNLQVLNFLNF